MISIESSIQIGEDTVYRELGGEAVILSLETGNYFGLNEVGLRIWQLIQDERSLRNVRDALVKEYDAPAATIEADLVRLVEELSTKGLVRVANEP